MGRAHVTVVPASVSAEFRGKHEATVTSINPQLLTSLMPS